MRFEFATAGRIVFGAGCSAELPELVRARRVLLVTGAGAERFGALLDAVQQAAAAAVRFVVAGEPDIETAAGAAAAGREHGCDAIVSIGGGSVIDCAKAAAALLHNSGDILHYLEVVGDAATLSRPAAPHIALPTTAGTGAEVTKNSVLRVKAHGVKVSMRSPYLLPSAALVDPLLTHDMPPELTAATGMDALTQLFEAFVSSRCNPFTDGLCREALPRAARALPAAYRDGTDAAAREEMSLASLFGGLALANAGLGAVHGLAGVIGGMYDAPHGMVCARLLPFVAEANAEALAARGTSAAQRRFLEAAALLGDGAASGRGNGPASFLHDLCAELRIKPLSAYGLTGVCIPEIVTRSLQASSMKGNPVPLERQELERVLHLAL